MVQFQNPIVGGDTLVRDAIKSQNYVMGSTGWSVNQDGTAEFNNVTIRNGETVSSTDLYYNGTPAAGNLIASISATQGTDAYGNIYFSGICSYYPSKNTYVQMLNGQIFTGLMSDTVDQSAQLGYNTITTTERGTYPANVHVAPVDGNFTYHAGIYATPGNDSTITRGPSTFTVERNGNAPVNHRISGVHIKTDYFGNALAKQTPTLNTGWAAGPAGGSYRALQFWLDTEDNLIMSGTIHTTSTTPSSTIFTLPATHQPHNYERPGVVSNSNSTYAARSLEINPNTGAVVIDPVPTLANMDIYIYATIPIGNIL